MTSDKVDLAMSVPSVRGRVRVQLNDATTGVPVHDEAHDNFVSERWLRAMAWFANWGAFARSSGTAPHSALFTSNAFSEIPFTGIALTDYDGTPDQNERAVRGAPAGHASIGSIGGGAWRGTYNAIESIHRFDYNKFVYDFATTEANATFQSIYTGHFSSDIRTEPTPEITQYSLNRRAWLSTDDLVRDDVSGSLYLCGASSISEVTDWTPIAMGGDPEVTELATLSPAAEPSAFAIRAGRMYWMTDYVSAQRQIISAPLSNLTNTQVEKTLDDTWAALHGGTSTRYVTGFTFHPQRDEFLISTDATNTLAPEFGIMALNSTTFADGDKFGGANFTRIRAVPGETGVLAAGHAVSLNADGSITITSDLADEPSPLGDRDLMLARETHTQYLTPAQLFFSRALLAAPVTKTALNTMKITYEFTFDDPALP